MLQAPDQSRCLQGWAPPPATPGQLRGVWEQSPWAAGSGSPVTAGTPNCWARSVRPRGQAQTLGAGLRARAGHSVQRSTPLPSSGGPAPRPGTGRSQAAGATAAQVSSAELPWGGATRTLWGDWLSGLQDAGHGSGHTGPRGATWGHTGPSRSSPRQPAPQHTQAHTVTLGHAPTAGRKGRREAPG